MANLKKLNNPCAIRKTSNRWLGEDTLNNSPYCKFTNVVYGIRATGIIIRTYVSKHRLTTVRDIINRYAPASDGNDVKSYLDFIIYYTRFITQGDYILTPSTQIESDYDLVLLILSIAKIESSSKFTYNFVYGILSKYDIHVSPQSTPF